MITGAECYLIADGLALGISTDQTPAHAEIPLAGRRWRILKIGPRVVLEEPDPMAKIENRASRDRRGITHGVLQRLSQMSARGKSRLKAKNGGAGFAERRSEHRA